MDPNEDLVAVVLGNKALQHTFRRALQHSFPGSDNVAGRSEMHVVLQTFFKVADDSVVEVVA